MKGMIWRALLVLAYWVSAVLLSWQLGGFVFAHAGWWALLLVVPFIFLLHGLFASVTVSLTLRKGKRS